MTGIAVLPEPVPEAVRAAVGTQPAPEQAQALVWLGEPEGLAGALQWMPAVRWVQLPWAGVEEFLPLMRAGVTWTSAAGVLAEPVAEHALMLAMVALRSADRSVRAGRWLPQPPRSLYDAEVLIVGGGAVTRALLRLLTPLRARVTVVRRSPVPVEGAYRVLGTDELADAAAEADVVVLTAALTPQTRGMIAEPVLRRMRPGACLVNVARGGLVNTADLVRALTEGWIAAAALDVTEPAPLPGSHPLWSLENCFLTAHCAGELPYAWPAFAELVRENAGRFRQGLPLRNTVAPALGY
ncbi:phosphoglycerate dehydrogenase-like enzyme [Kitasatospora sp. MAA4]|uniref:NAD(P)-dependent oxidoreductase n=1 Tax=Kitasatospora sp. MAA4 TaxID=3035093 RepID=UPI0024733552|nr:NAD(P)-dependent oxidoreductase [Kitasatospora sp. MAA4]MDH6136212.1 phosphoglycerate dehydrogenase-like enzyme [Kitasatospora sp. MAA4]